MRSLQLACVGVAVLFFAAAGCNREQNKGGGAPIRLVFMSNNNAEFWTFARRGGEKAAKELGFEFEFKMPPSGKAEEQKEFIQDLLVKGVNGIALSPNDAKNMADFLDGVNKKIPVLTVDSDIPNLKGRRAYLGTDNYLAGRAVGKLVADALPKGGKIVIFVGTLDVLNAVERRQGVLDYLAGKDQKTIGELTPGNAQDAKFGNFILVDTKTDEKSQTRCQELCEDILTRNPDVSAVVGLWAYNPPALLRAVEKMKTKPLIVGFDEDEATLVGIEDGKIVGTVVQAPFEFGQQSMKILHGLAKGDESVLKKYPGITAENRIFVPHEVITKDNVGPFHAKVKSLLAK